MMNERIQQLEKQCWETQQLTSGANSWHTSFNSRKFAELIIAKCIEEAGDPADGLIKGDTWHDGVRASVWSIRQYFGVEE